MKLGVNLLRDLRYAARLLAKNLRLTAVVVLLIGLGVGLSTGIYSLADAVLLQPVPIDRPDQVFEVAGFAAYPEYLDLRKQSQAFSGLLAYDTVDLVVGSGTSHETVGGAFVSENYFDVLRAPLALGRGFVAEEAQPPSSFVAVLSHRFWRRRLGGDPGVVGRRIQLEGEMFTVVGVASEGFQGTVLRSPVDIWVPIAVFPRLSHSGEDRFYGRRSRWLRVVGRLREGISPKQAELSARTLLRHINEAFPHDRAPVDATLIPLGVAASGQATRDDFVRFIALLVGIAATILLLACANLANLLSIRALRRGREIAVRLALGASRAALLRQLLIESLLLGLLGGAFALPVAIGFLRLVRSFELPGKIPIETLGLGLTPWALVFAGVGALLTALLFGVVPVLHAFRLDLPQELAQKSPSSGRRMAQLRGVLVAVQVALALVLLVTGGLFAKTLRNGFSQNLGFASEELAVLHIGLDSNQYSAARGAAFYTTLLERLDALPGVLSASQVEVLPLGRSRWRTNPVIGGRSLKESTEVYMNLVGTSYFETMGIPLVRGRSFDERDGRAITRVAVINETMARLLFVGQDPLGIKVFPFAQDDRSFEIVGIVKDSTYHGLSSPPVPFLFLPYSQDFAQTHLTRFLVVRTRAPAGILARLRSELQALDPAIPYEGNVFRSYVGRILMPQSFGLRLLGAFGMLALILACVGIYSVLTYSVETRLREIAVRRALGARNTDIVQLVLTQAVPPIVAGFFGGVIVALGLGRFYASFLYGIDASDPATFIEISTLMAVFAFGSALLPAIRASRIKVMAELRDG